MQARIPKREIEALGAGIFIRKRNIESRLSEEDFHRAFNEPVIVWIAPGEFQKDKVGSLLDAVKKLHAIQRFRFPNVSVPSEILERIHREFPEGIVEGVKKKKPSQTTEPTAPSGRGSS